MFTLYIYAYIISIASQDQIIINTQGWVGEPIVPTEQKVTEVVASVGSPQPIFQPPPHHYLK